MLANMSHLLACVNLFNLHIRFCMVAVLRVAFFIRNCAWMRIISCVFGLQSSCDNTETANRNALYCFKIFRHTSITKQYVHSYLDVIFIVSMGLVRSPVRELWLAASVFGLTEVAQGADYKNWPSRILVLALRLDRGFGEGQFLDENAPKNLTLSN